MSTFSIGRTALAVKSAVSSDASDGPSKKDAVLAARKAYPDRLGKSVDPEDKKLPAAVRSALDDILYSLGAEYGDAELHTLQVKGETLYYALGLGDDDAAAVLLDKKGKTVASGASDLTPNDSEFWKTPYTVSPRPKPPAKGSIEAAIQAVFKCPGVLGVEENGNQLTVGLEHNTVENRKTVSDAVQAVRDGVSLVFEGAHKWDWDHE